MKFITMLAMTLGLGLTVASMAKADGCKDGTKVVFLEDDGSGEHLVPVQYVCVGGVYQRAFATVQSKAKDCSCVEGTEQMFLTDDGSGEHMNPVLYICKGGVFVPENN